MGGEIVNDELSITGTNTAVDRPIGESASSNTTGGDTAIDQPDNSTPGSIPKTGINGNFASWFGNNQRDPGTTRRVIEARQHNDNESESASQDTNGHASGDAFSDREGPGDRARSSQAASGAATTFGSSLRSGNDTSQDSGYDNRAADAASDAGIEQASKLVTMLRARGLSPNKIGKALGCSPTQIFRLQAKEVKAAVNYVPGLTELLEQTPAPTRPLATPLPEPIQEPPPRPQGFAMPPPPEPPKQQATPVQKIKKVATGVLSDSEAAGVKDDLIEMIIEAFKSIDSTLGRLFPLIDEKTGDLIPPGVWDDISAEEADRLATTLISIGRHNVYVARAIRAAEATNDYRKLAKIFYGRGIATGTWIKGSRDQQRKLRK